MSRSRPGFTIVELIVSMVILGLLAALVLPAVQQARESSRRMKCKNNLKQWGLSMAQHCETHGWYPAGTTIMIDMLPGIGQGALYNSLIDLREGKLTGPQMDAIQFKVPEFICPDDPLCLPRDGSSNYYPNDGTLLHIHKPRNGYDQGDRATHPSDVVDGLSHTAAMAERLVGLHGVPPAEMEQQPKRYFWFTPTSYPQRSDVLLAVKECREHRTTTFPQFHVSEMSAYMAYEHSYNHLLLPNEPACYNGPEDWKMVDLKYLVPPSSLHDGGVNILFMDGSVHFISEVLDETVWRALGTINGGESVADPF